MTLPWALAILSLLPLLEAQKLPCANLTAAPITNATLEWISGKWFYIASAFRNPEYKQEAQAIQADFFYFTANLTEDTVLLREYQTKGDKCIYNSSYLKVQRENGSLSKYEWGRENFGYLVLLQDPRTFILNFYPEDKQNEGLSFYTDKPEATQEQLEVFHEAMACMGMQKSEAIYTDWKKDQCGPLEKQHEEERKKRTEES
ncbi:PREDICTED: alpha-1-acid glycoprotein 1 [Galeopterus variegatus]|uniref:Alpha-1-acid glycoprotein n=1 Tax=Galeopterus variegatus TaxID=482537 RepID=A0ABM0S5F3_GALVR|nr:PREDICTED: alpha-1-acid glycoprotein 1 [Galeopterus variegatus]